MRKLNRPDSLPLCKKLQSYPDGDILVDTQSDYQRIQIVHHPVYGNQLGLDGDLQISESDKAYNTAMVAPLLTLENPKHIAILGGGDGGVLAEAVSALGDNKSLSSIKMIDIDGEVVRLSQRYLTELNNNVFQHPKTDVLVGDALDFIEQSENLDGVIYDLTMDPIRDDQSQQAYVDYILEKIAESLKVGGVISMQCCGQYEEESHKEYDRKVLLEQIKISAERFFSGIIEQHVFIPSFHEMWTFLAGVRRVV